MSSASDSPPPPLLGPGLVAFFTERHLATLTTLRADGTPHVVPVGVTLDAATGTARVITSGTSAKVRHVRRGQVQGGQVQGGQVQGGQAQGGPARVAVCQVDGKVWTTLEGTAVVREDAGSVADAEARYAVRYQQPRVNPARVVLEISVDRVLGNAERWRGPEAPQ
ncbi:pyridoxamine 5'-phosphate oxidase family protein [Modestobacter sp. VKM Ac-2985]|uniref:pyridoxamine 5'-phosphate oxidase family protein n=1 Tax=Modestobacter sp. VKM Ac-2985 TaxID=3004139 RepID=UPI0022ABBB05|nr:pyridoxamine 5'-phosphate oxidase family protein [Modestobacter sp. VKM Ac-2985]MCZ2838631.1 pyridoxamine 5'-phosphate oxidase family protein [Modestobacter sp. VKM Ac-2985]